MQQEVVHKIDRKIPAEIIENSGLIKKIKKFYHRPSHEILFIPCESSQKDQEISREYVISNVLPYERINRQDPRKNKPETLNEVRIGNLKISHEPLSNETSYVLETIVEDSGSKISTHLDLSTYSSGDWIYLPKFKMLVTLNKYNKTIKEEVDIFNDPKKEKNYGDPFEIFSRKLFELYNEALFRDYNSSSSTDLPNNL